jgi:hypothetical protein
MKRTTKVRFIGFTDQLIVCFYVFQNVNKSLI